MVLFVFSFAGLSMVAIQGKAQVIMIALLCPKEVGSHLMSGNLYGMGYTYPNKSLISGSIV